MGQQQLTINFDAGPFEGFDTCREFIQAISFQQEMQQKYIAAEMGYSPQQLSRKLAQNPDDSARLTLDDAEKFLEITKDPRPIYFLFNKFFAKQTLAEKKKLLKQLKDELGEG